jgi:predicted transcriptional regulator
LAAEVLAVVAAAALTPREVMNRIDRRLAYTTMTTVLTRLHAKGLLGGSLLRLLP